MSARDEIASVRQVYYIRQLLPAAARMMSEAECTILAEALDTNAITRGDCRVIIPRLKTLASAASFRHPVEDFANGRSVDQWRDAIVHGREAYR